MHNNLLVLTWGKSVPQNGTNLKQKDTTKLTFRLDATNLIGCVIIPEDAVTCLDVQSLLGNRCRYQQPTLAKFKVLNYLLLDSGAHACCEI